MIGDSLREAFFMFWETLWALVLGFALSGAVQAFVSRGQMRRVMGRHGPAALARSSLLGMASSSCSYAASALARSLFQRGADFTAAMVFMFASTNLVAELGIVLWLLIGWQFTLAEFAGGAIMIVLLGLLLPRLVPRRLVAAARERLDRDEASGHGGHRPPARGRPAGRAAAPARSLGRRGRLHDLRPVDAAARDRHRLRRGGFRRGRGPGQLLERRIPAWPRSPHPGRERPRRAVRRDHQLRLLGRQRAAGGRAVARRDQLRRGGGLRLRRPDLAAAAGHLPQDVRRAADAAAARRLLARHERRGPAHRADRHRRPASSRPPARPSSRPST